MISLRCLACDKQLGGETRSRVDFCQECDSIISMLVLEEVELELAIEIPFGLYEDWEWEEKEDAEDNQ